MKNGTYASPVPCEQDIATLEFVRIYRDSNLYMSIGERFIRIGLVKLTAERVQV
jgi:hypothetical protein